jgi:hypothetical protein
LSQEAPAAQRHTVASANDVSGIDVTASTTGVAYADLPPGPNSEDVQAAGPCGTIEGPTPLAVAQVGICSSAILEGRPGSEEFAGSVASADSKVSPPEWARIALRNARAELFAEMQGSAVPLGRYYPSMEWHDLPAKLPFSWTKQVLHLEARRSGGFLSRHTHELRESEFNGVVLEHRLAADEIFTGALDNHARRIAREEDDRRQDEWREAELIRCGCF